MGEGAGAVTVRVTGTGTSTVTGAGAFTGTGHDPGIEVFIQKYCITRIAVVEATKKVAAIRLLIFVPVEAQLLNGDICVHSSKPLCLYSFW